MIPAIPFKSKIEATELFKISPFKQVIKPTVPHKHAGYFELIILFDGSGEHQIDDVIYEVTPPTAFFLKPGQIHCWNFSKIPKGYVLLFREEMLNAHDLSFCYQLPAQFAIQGTQHMPTLLETILTEYRSNTAQPQIIRAYLHLIITKLSLLSAGETPQVQPALYHQFKSLLLQQDIANRQVKYYAEKLNVSVQHLTRVCKTATGKTLSEMLNERTLMDAKVLLGNTDGPIKTIAFELGFTDTSHFVKFFRSGTNLTPGEYRNKAINYRNKN